MDLKNQATPGGRRYIFSLRLILMIMVVIALVVRGAVLVGDHDFYADTGRMVIQYEMAHQLAAGNGFVADEAFVEKAGALDVAEKRNIDFVELKSRIKHEGPVRVPVISDTWGYAALLALLWKVTGVQSLLVLQMVQIVIDGIMVLLIYGIARRLCERNDVALVAAALYALATPIAHFAALANRDIFAVWGVISSTYFFLRGFSPVPRMRFLVLSGLSLAVTSWFRPTWVFLPAIFVAYSLIKDSRLVKRHVLVLAATALPLLAVFVAPMSLVYKQYHGTYNFTAGQAGANLWEGLGAYPNPYGFELSDEAGLRRARELGYYGPAWTPEHSAVLRREALAVITSHPWFYFSYVTKNVAKGLTAAVHFEQPSALMDPRQSLVSHMESGGGVASFFAQGPLNAAIRIMLRGSGALLTLLAFSALFVAGRYLRALSLLYLIWFSKIFFHSLVHIETRYVLEGSFPLLILAAFAILWVADRVRGPKGDMQAAAAALVGRAN